MRAGDIIDCRVDSLLRWLAGWAGPLNTAIGCKTEIMKNPSHHPGRTIIENIICINNKYSNKDYSPTTKYECDGGQSKLKQ